MTNAGYSCLRRTFCWLNVIFCVCSCIFVAAGLWLRLSYEGYATLLPDHLLLSANTLLLGIGALGFSASFLGCCGALLQFRCCLVLYFMLIILLMLNELVVGVLIFVFRGGLARVLINELRFGIEKHYNMTDRGSILVPSIAVVWDNLQQSFQCCGVSSYDDWFNIQAWPGKSWVPDSCCKSLFDTRQILTEGSGDALSKLDCSRSENPVLWWEKGCAPTIQEWVFAKLNIIGTVGLGVVFVQLFGLMTSLLLFCSAKHKNESDSYKSYTPSIEPATRISSWED